MKDQETKILNEKGEELLEVKKSKSADLEGFKGMWLLIGYVMVLAALFVAFELTQGEKTIDDSMIVAEVVLEEEIEIPITMPEKKQIPPPEQAVKTAEVLNIVEDDAEIEETTLVSTEDQSEYVEIKEDAIVVVEEEPEEEKIFQVAEDMPEFPGGQAALFKYLKDNIKYPSICQENGTQGRSTIQFVVNRDGSIVEPVVVRSAGDPYLDKEALRVIKSMPKWKPGMQRGKAVRVKFTLPVTFKLQ